MSGSGQLAQIISIQNARGSGLAVSEILQGVKYEVQAQAYESIDQDTVELSEHSLTDIERHAKRRRKRGIVVAQEPTPYE